jgi:catechol 2,3-dioxygenase-like lactoylglutathione lyase family enzyme
MVGRVIGFAEVGLRVSNLARMITFYREMLGFEVHIREAHHAFLEVGESTSPLGATGHPQLLALFERDAVLDAKLTTLDHLAFEIPNQDYDTELARFAAHGMVIKERSWPDTLDWPARSFFFRDPEGNVIELVAANP